MVRPAVVPPSAPVGERLRVIEPVASTSGKSAARATRIAACACRYCASEAARVWFDFSMRSTNELSCASAKISHHFPFSIASLGWACFQPAGVSRNSALCGVAGRS